MDLSAIDPMIVIASLSAALITTLLFVTTKKQATPTKQLCNPGIKKEEHKVVDTYNLTDIEELVNKSEKGVVAFCRCWRSGKFPLCDGTHNKFNEECGDNTGPLLIKKSK